MCNGNCTCKDKITTEWVDDNGRQQLKFAVPPEGLNEAEVDVVEELWKEVDDYLIMQSDDIRLGIEDVRYMRMLRGDIKNIFNKYRK